MSVLASFRFITTKFPQSISSPKTLTLINTQFLPKIPTFFKPITIQSIPTRPFCPKSTNQQSLQPISQLPPKLQEIVRMFQSVQDSRAKYEQVLFYGKNLKKMDERLKTDENKVPGCVSQVWVRAYLDGERRNVVYFEADSDTMFTRGLAALLVEGLSGISVEEILRVTPDFVVVMGLNQSLNPSRNNGFLNMLKLMQKKAAKLCMDAEQGVVTDNAIENVADGDGNGRPIAEKDVKSIFEVEKEIVQSVATSTEKSDESSLRGTSVLGSRGERIKEVLGRELRPIELEVEDVSYKHAGHAGVRGSDGETHFNLKIVSKEFEGKSLVKRHRLIYSLLEDELQNGLHALSIEAKTPAEVDGR